MEPIYEDLVRLAAAVDPRNPDPSDLVQAALERVLRRHGLAELDNPVGYISTTIVRLGANRRRAEHRLRRLVSRLGSVDAGSVGSAEREYVSNAETVRLLEQLTPSERAIVYLRYIEALDYLEIATRLGLTEASTRQRASRALRRLRAGIEETLHDE
ncbi:MAG: sigma-70 family RNA polymerase sigma factor [Acidimicrobiales bacterium]